MQRLVHAAVHNPVAANILMVVIVVAGAWSALSLQREVMPQLSFDIIQIRIEFEGATPEEVEESVAIKVEEAIHTIEGVRRVFSKSFEGIGMIFAELEPGVDNRAVRDDIEDEVGKIDTFPEEAKEPQYVELKEQDQVINIAVYGEQPESTLKETAKQVRDDLLATSDISQVEIVGTRDYEIAIEIAESTLRRYGLTLDEVSQLVRVSSLELSAGDIKTPTQDIVVRTTGQRYTAEEFAAIPLLTTETGALITLGSVANVIDGFEDTDLSGFFNGKPGVLVTVLKAEQEGALNIAEIVHHYVKEQQSRLPEGLQLSVWADTSPIIKGRLQLLTNNGLMGLLLVAASLWFFMNLRLAFWVAAGLPVAFMGAFWLIDYYGNTMNMITMFACIMAIGILVDDAIVVGENIYSHWRRGKSPIQAAIDGTSEVALPVVAAVATTIAAFIPLFIMEGIMGKFIAVIPVAMVAALLASLIECLIIMPSHLAHSLPLRDDAQATSRGMRAVPQRLRRAIETSVDWTIERFYGPILRWAVTYRLIVAATALAILMLALGVVGGGHINFFLFPKTDAEYVLSRLTLPQGTPSDRTLAISKQIEEAAWQVNRVLAAEEQDPAVKNAMTVVGRHTSRSPEIGSHASEVTIELAPVEQRRVSSTEILAKWRELTGDVPEALALTFGTPEFGPGGAPIEVRLIGEAFDDLRQAADRVKAELNTYPGVFDIEDDFRPGKVEMRLALKPEARVLGLTLADLARQMRQGFFGAEALRVQRGRDDVSVMVRYPESERRALGDVENMRIRTPDGREIPFGEVASVTLQRGYAVIHHDDRERVVAVTADVDTNMANAAKVLADLEAGFLPKLMAGYDGLRFSFEGQQRETQRSINSLFRGFVLAMLLIYGILATIFRSYLQPLIVMSVIPFGLIGALVGHLLMGHALTMMSLFGLVALSGVVVNDSLVLLDFVNRAMRQGLPVEQAIHVGGQARFRAIMLTTITTVAGLLPILLEGSFQAQFLIPMAISISFGLMGATFLVLLLVPALYMLLYDFRQICNWLWNGTWQLPEEREPEKWQVAEALGVAQK
ncbi:efflux RND transporter permease subunit [Candidatus Entotheonella palauensis]|nr:efflux RND transporter permease subunit [Candidatus Entotheonella palauensis]